VAAYAYGAPLAVTPSTVIREYEIPKPNAIREAVLAGSPQRLWIADVSSNRMYVVDPLTGAREVIEVPHAGLVGPHSLHRGADGSLWIAPLFHSVVANVDVEERRWRTWPTKSIRGDAISMHDLSFGSDHELLTDTQSRIWFSDILHNAVGYIDPTTGAAESFPAPEIPGRPSERALLYGLAMAPDRKHVWYGQLGIGSFGSFNVQTRTFDPPVLLPSMLSGPRRITFGDDDRLYVPLYGTGQLLVYDTRARRQVGLYDLPDRASAPYAVTWDPVRKVVWIPTSNADAIYRFDPKTQAFAVIPLPRAGAFLRMLDVDPRTGALVTCYGNVIETVKGPRMALVIDPGDGAYARSVAQAGTDRGAGFAP
jgi:streptogramin lyase